MIHVPTAWWNWDYDHMPAVYADPDEEPDEMPPIVKTGDQKAFTRQAQHIREKYGVYISCLIFGSHWEKAYFTRGIENFLADLAGAPEFSQELLDFIIGHNMEMLKDTYGQHITFWGGISTQGVLPFGTPGEVAAETQRVIDLMSAGGGYITCSSQEIQTDVPYENLKALIDTAWANG